jgi:hypothetical protein
MVLWSPLEFNYRERRRLAKLEAAATEEKPAEKPCR